MLKKILFVDDDANVLAGLRRMLRVFRDEWEMHFANSGKEALALLAEGPCTVIVTDMRMPGMDGAELLQFVRDLYPGVIRICLSGYSDFESSIKVVGLAHQYLSKPCDANLLKSTITRACALHDHLHDPVLRQALSCLESIPSLPEGYQAVIAELNRAEPSLARVGEIMSQDMAMTAKILQMVNSSFFGLGRRVTNAKEAVTLLGLGTVHALVLSTCVFSHLEKDACGELSSDDLMHHSLEVATAAKAIAADVTGDRDIVNDSFVAGLLHDVGKLVLAARFQGTYGAALASGGAAGLQSTTVETDRFGANHADVGAFLMNLWGLPSPLVEAIAFHHSPDRAQSDVFAPLTAVHVANALIKELHEGGKTHTTLHFAYLWKLKLMERIDKWRELVKSVTPTGALV